MTPKQIDSHILRHEFDRTEEFRPNPRLVDLIGRLKQLLEPVQIQQNAQFAAPQYPVVVIVGCPRSGTTVLTQILAASGSFAFPTNFLARFAYAPLIGAMIQQMIFNREYDFRDELSDIRSSSDFRSAVGKTAGALGINEFFHFWRKFFPNHDPGHLTNEELALVDTVRMRSELAAIESVFVKPFMSKGMMMQYNIAYFAEQVPELFFIHIKRETRYVLQSVLMSRRRFYGDQPIWWSVKPKEYEWLAGMDLFYQVAGQVLFTEKAIDDQLASVDDSRKLVCHYEQLCAAPHSFFDSLRASLNDRGCTIGEYEIAQQFPTGNTLKIAEAELRRLEQAYAELQADSIRREKQT